MREKGHVVAYTASDQLTRVMRFELGCLNGYEFILELGERISMHYKRSFPEQYSEIAIIMRVPDGDCVHFTIRMEHDEFPEEFELTLCIDSNQIVYGILSHILDTKKMENTRRHCLSSTTERSMLSCMLSFQCNKSRAYR
jgi:hypothetical protein